MTESTIPIKKAIPIVAVTWILSLLTTLAIVYFTPFVPVGTNQIADSAIITTKLADGSVTSAKIMDGTLTAVDLGDGSVISVKVADGAVTTSKIADGSVTTAKIADNAIVTIKLADGSVTSAKIQDGTIAATDLATGSVTTIQIVDGAVTTAKIADGAVAGIKLASEAIPFAYAVSPYSEVTTSTSWEDMPDMVVNLTVTRTSHLIIMFSCFAYVETAGYSLNIRANVPTSLYPIPYPMVVGLTRATFDKAGSYSFIFNLPDVSAGVHTIKIQWLVSSAATRGIVGERTLTVFALPA